MFSYKEIVDFPEHNKLPYVLVPYQVVFARCDLSMVSDSVGGKDSRRTRPLHWPDPSSLQLLGNNENEIWKYEFIISETKSYSRILGPPL